MTRRRFVVTVSAIAILAMMLIVLGVAVGVTQTAYGRAWVRRALVAQLTPAVKGGKLYVGNISGGLITGATIDSLEIRDADDSVFVATGRVTVAWDPRDLLDRRVLLSAVRVEHPFVHVRKGEDGVWNFRRIFPSGPPKPPRTQPGFGDFIVADTATIYRGAFYLTMPWHPADSLGSGARRDSAIAYNLARRDVEIREVPPPRGAGPRAPRRFVKSWRWTRAEIAASHVRLADPDSAGRAFVLSRLSVAESDPPFRFSNVRGTVRMLKDSLWLDVPHWDAPASTGSATGKVVWGSDLPTRYDIRVVGDSVSLNDVAWVYPTLPRAGGGRMLLHIKNQPANLNVLEYAISRMDVRTTASRLTGQMTFGVGGPVLVVKDVAMQAAPLDFALIRTLNGKPFPYDWRGQITGSVRARGGPLNRFQVDQADFVFRDANVPGAVTRGAGRGGLDILFPAFTAFRGFDVAVEQLDLRTLQFLNPDFPRLGGTVRGRAVLDSSWLDVRFRDADLTHRDGPDAPSRFTGSGRVTWGDEFMRYDLALQAQPLSLTTLARSYAALPARGSYQGPLRVIGTIADLDLTSTLTGPAGTMSVDGHFDLFPAGYAARGRGSVAGLDLRTLLPGLAAAPATSLSTQFEMDLAGDSLANLTGALALDLERSRVEAVQLNGGRTRLRFEGGVVRADTIAVESEVATLAGAGAIGLSRAHSDSLRFTVGVGSLDALRRVLGAAEGDTLAGELTVRGVAVGSVDSLGVTGSIAGRGLYASGVSAADLTGRFNLFGLPAAAAGHVGVRFDSVSAGGRRLQYLVADATLEGPGLGRFAVDAADARGTRLSAGGSARVAGDSADVAVDSLTLALGEHVWRLEGAAAVRRTPFELAVDTMVLRGSAGGRVILGGVLPATAPVRFAVRADGVPLADFATLAGSGGTLDGAATLAMTVGGTRERPTIDAQASVADGRFGDVRVERLTATGRYADRRLETALGLRTGGEDLVRANLSLPLDLALVPVERRLLDEPLRGTVRADSVNLGLLEAMTSAVQRASGNLRLLVDVGGTWESPTLDGSVLVTDGAMTLPGLGVRLERVSADVALARDSVDIRRIAASTTGRKTGSITLRGGLGLADRDDPSFDLTLNANYFHAINKARVADLYLSTTGPQGLHLAGSVRRSRLTGGVFVPSGQIYIPDIARKNVVSLDDPEFYQIVDTTLTTNRTLLPNAPPAVVRNLTVEDVRIAMGEDVWLRSSEANINLGGDVAVTVGRDERDRRDSSDVLFALSGQLLAERGTYRLNLGLALQRTFEVESGTLRFYGDPDLNPNLDISAVHTVRQANQSDRDVPIRVRIGGTLAQPTLTLSSADPNLQLSESDAISYLITGQPSFVIAGNNQQYTSQAAGVILPSIGSYFGDKVANSLGLDVVQIETSGSTAAGTGDLFSSTLANTRFGGGVQIGSRTFIRANLGLCPFAQELGIGSTSGGGGSDRPLYSNVLTSIGAKLEYRLSDSYSASLGLDPPTKEVLSCASRGATPSNFVTTPQQFGLDFTRKWEF